MSSPSLRFNFLVMLVGIEKFSFVVMNVAFMLFPSFELKFNSHFPLYIKICVERTS